MNKITENRTAISFVDEKYKDRILRTLSTFSEIEIDEIEFTTINPEHSATKIACKLINKLCADGFKLFIVGLSRSFDIVVIYEIMFHMRKDDNIKLIIVTSLNDIMSRDGENRRIYKRIVDSAYRVLLNI